MGWRSPGRPGARRSPTRPARTNVMWGSREGCPGRNVGGWKSAVKCDGGGGAARSWGGTSIVGAVPAGATSGNVVVTVGGTASNGVAFAVTTGSTKYPIKASANNRYFVDQSGTPWLMVGDSAHTGICKLPQSSWAAYLQDRQNQGFNTIDLLALDAATSCAFPTSGAAADGTLPFTTGTTPATYDLSTPNNAFWSEVDTFISEAAAHGLVVSLDPMAWGNGFAVTYQNNGTTKVFNFGVFLGNRYKNSPNIIWHVGQDFDANSFPSSSNLNLMAQLMTGIARVDRYQLINYPLHYYRSHYTHGHPTTVPSSAIL